MSSPKGMVQTVLGILSPDTVGRALMHEHIVVDYSTNFGVPTSDTARSKIGGLTLEEQINLWKKPLSIEDVGHVKLYFNQNADNMRLDDISAMCKEVTDFKRFGGRTIVELTITGIQPDPAALRKISETTGVNIVMGTGYYLARTHPTDMQQKTVEQLTKEFVNAITIGVQGDIKAGIIGELGCSTNLDLNEIKVLKAAATASKVTGAAISIHPGYGSKCPFEILDILQGHGADLSRVIMGHVDRGILTDDELMKLAKRGCVLEFDQFGFGCTLTHALSHNIDYPSDFVRCQSIKQLCDAGFIDQVVLSHDVAFKYRLAKFGGDGYAHLLKNIVPYMLKRGFTDDDIETLFVRNPRRLLTLV